MVSSVTRQRKLSISTSGQNHFNESEGGGRVRDTGPPDNTDDPVVVVALGPSYCFLGTFLQGWIGELRVARGVKTEPDRHRRDILDLFPAQREFVNNPGKRFVKLETSGRHIYRDVFKIKAAGFLFNNNYFQ